MVSLVFPVTSVTRDPHWQEAHIRREEPSGHRGLCSLWASLLGGSVGQEYGGHRLRLSLMEQTAAPPVVASFLAWPGLPSSPVALSPIAELPEFGHGPGTYKACLQGRAGHRAGPGSGPRWAELCCAHPWPRSLSRDGECQVQPCCLLVPSSKNVIQSVCCLPGTGYCLIKFSLELVRSFLCSSPFY